MWSWHRGSRGLAIVFALVAVLPAVTLAKALSWPVLALVGRAGRGDRVEPVVADVGHGHPLGCPLPPEGRRRLHAGRRTGRERAGGEAPRRRRPAVAWRACRGGGGGGCPRSRSRCGSAGSGCCTCGHRSRTSRSCSAAHGPARRSGSPAGSSTPRALSWSPPPAPTSTSCVPRCGGGAGRCTCSTPSVSPVSRRRSPSTR